ncbi:MAG: pantetheine-phosphate adenylyltransferase [Clostridiales bacterium]
MKIAVYPGTFDPVTVGHIHIAERACRLFDRVVIAIANQNYKRALFSLEERQAFMEEAIVHLPNCSITVYDSLTVDLARDIGAHAIIRGLRAVSDYEYEMQVAAINKYLDEGIETIFLMSSSEYSFISSSMIKQVASSNARIAGLVTPGVERALKRKFADDLESLNSL